MKTQSKAVARTGRLPQRWKQEANLLKQIYDFKYLMINQRKHRIDLFYHINYGAIQGFPALRKAITTHMKKISYFFKCV